MRDFKRTLNFESVLKRKSLFLFGPRQTGKSYFLKKHFSDVLYIDLLLNENYSQYLKKPELLRKHVELYFRENSRHLVIIDEVQKIPRLLNEVHYLIEKYKTSRFILTGSSARKLKSQNTNMLGGRASMVNIYPFTYLELSSQIKILDFKELLTTGTIPSVFTSSEPYEDLKDYVNVYLKEEIKLEGLVRNLGTFAEFLDIVAASCTQQINYSNFANDTQISVPTAREYFQILEDTLIGIRVAPFNKTKKRKAVASSKFYFFDVGLINGLLKRKEVSESTTEFGVLFEQYIFQEIRAYLGYFGPDFNLEYWRTKDQSEVDFVVYDNLQNIHAIEVKLGKNLRKKDFSGLNKLNEEVSLRKKIIVTYHGQSMLEDNDIEVYNILDFLERLWSHKLISC